MTNKEKESLYSTKEKYKKQIQELISTVKNLKQERNDLTSQVKISKEQRENISVKIPELTKKLQELTEQKRAIFEKLGIKRDYMTIKKDIEILENKIVTEPMSFSAEKKVMAIIKVHKKELKNASQIRDFMKQIKEIVQELELYKNIRNISNSKVKNIAKDSQYKHVNMVEHSKKIDDLKVKEESLRLAGSLLDITTKRFNAEVVSQLDVTRSSAALSLLSHRNTRSSWNSAKGFLKRRK